MPELARITSERYPPPDEEDTHFRRRRTHGGDALSDAVP
jgi:hypothetical protein